MSLEALVGAEGAASVLAFLGGRPLRSLLAADFAALPGMNKAKAARLVAAVEFVQNYQPAPPQFVRDAETVYALFKDLALLEQEEVHVVLLSNRLQVMGRRMVSRGTVGECRIALSDIFRPAIVAGAPSLIIVHNHPSGDPTPSAADVSMTKKAKEIGLAMGIKVLDHVVIAANGYERIEA